MKLNYKNTFYIGLIFFIISLFWQTYDMMIARTMIDKFGLNQTWSGIVMAIDNVMAVILLPLFGALSDKSNSKKGRRTPYIIVGTILAAFSFMFLSYADYLQTLKIQATDIVSEHYDIAFGDDVDSSERNHWYDVIDQMDDERQNAFLLGDISLNELNDYEDDIKNPMLSILGNNGETLNNRDLSMIKDMYYKYLSERAWEVTSTNLTNLIIFTSILFIALVSMTIFRSPAVALMPDVTIKPLRSKANAIITLMGAFGGILAVYIIMLSGLNKHAYDHHGIVYIIVGVVMIIALIIFLWKVDEPKLVREKQEVDHTLGYAPEQLQNQPKKTLKSMTIKRRMSLYFLLASVFLLFMGYNAVMSKIADYLPKVLNLNYFDYQFIIAQALVVVAILPIGILSMAIGRKRTVLLGMAIMVFALINAATINEGSAWLAAGMIALAGIGWTMIGINTYVMVVEVSKGYDVGRYTGYYYAASMSAQIVTPILSGILMDQYGRIILFPYAAFFVALSIVTMLFVKQGEAKKIKGSLLAALEEVE
ncbi:MAG: MFS transporter [Acholeplasmataceae bacterium]|jgi:MFS family permease|nr:MFS transporter [Acholeplasmataceae bacterium]